jgi:hypothetical protein
MIGKGVGAMAGPRSPRQMIAAVVSAWEASADRYLCAGRGPGVGKSANDPALLSIRRSGLVS